jgi:hypothetical protein
VLGGVGGLGVGHATTDRRPLHRFHRDGLGVEVCRNLVTKRTHVIVSTSNSHHMAMNWTNQRLKMWMSLHCMCHKRLRDKGRQMVSVDRASYHSMERFSTMAFSAMVWSWACLQVRRS